VAGADGIVATPVDPVGDALFDAAGPQLKVVANFAVGTDNIDFDAARARGIVITNTPDVLTAATAELAIGILLALMRRIAEGDRMLRRREPWVWSTTFMLGTGLQGLTLGVLGYGRIGREVGRLAEAFGMTVLPMRDLDRIGDVDVLTLHCPLKPETRHLIDAAALVRMKPTAVLVNTARGPVVDEEALVEALRSGTIAGAALDVHEREPEITEEFLSMENVVVLPHLGSATVAAREGMGRLCIEGLSAVLLEGRDPANRVA
jgi:lactate dehydrogenase-like 2-hydroxyacid dehydrogenase